ncbi:WYL domain-containing protein [Streptomyces sp. SID13031]|nr:WYL domain-containing protein [Streptomyces sp. SID13031]
MVAPVDHAVLTTLALGCRDSERVRFGYQAANGTRSERLVEPLQLVPLGSRWYLVAYDLDRHDWRTNGGNGAHLVLSRVVSRRSKAPSVTAVAGTMANGCESPSNGECSGTKP